MHANVSDALITNCIRVGIQPGRVEPASPIELATPRADISVGLQFAYATCEAV